MVFGICGGYQIMGRSVSDPHGVEGDPRTVPGLGLLPVETMLTTGKVTRQVEFSFLGGTELCKGYEIHMGDTVITGDATPVNLMSSGLPDGCMTDDRCMGSYIHGILDNDCVIRHILSQCGTALTDVPATDYAAWRDSQYDALAEALRRHLDMEAIYKIMRGDD